MVYTGGGAEAKGGLGQASNIGPLKPHYGPFGSIRARRGASKNQGPSIDPKFLHRMMHLEGAA